MQDEGRRRVAVPAEGGREGPREPVWFVRAVLLLFFAAFAAYVALQVRDVLRFL